MNTPAAKTPRVRGAVLYTRVSTDEQDKHGTSPETQLDACRKKALDLSLPIVAEYHDGGISGGFLLTRPGMQAALADIQAGRADTLICANISRFSRDVEHQQSIKKTVSAAGGRLVFCDMTFDDTPEGDMAFGFMGQFAQYEKAVIKKRTAGGRQRKAEQGIQPSRKTSPYGYSIATHADVLRGQAAFDEVGLYRVREDQAAHVRRMFGEYHAGRQSLAGIARLLTLGLVPTPGKSTQWSQTTIRYILANPVYKGVAVYGRFDNHLDESRMQTPHWRTGELMTAPNARRPADPETWVMMDCPALVTADVWDAVQARLAANKAKKGGNPARVRMLAGRILCPYCGGTLGAGSKTRRSRQGVLGAAPQRYICLRYMKTVQQTGSGECEAIGYACEDVEAAVIAAILDAAKRPHALAEALRAYRAKLPAQAPAPDARQEMKRLDKALSDLAEKQAATVQAQISGIMQGAPADAYAAAFADLAAQRKDLEDRRGLLSRQLRAEQPRKAQGKEIDALPEEQHIEQQALVDIVRVLASPTLLGSVKRDALAWLIEDVTPRRDTRPREDMVTAVRFVPGALNAEGLDMGETMQSIKLGSLSTRALFSVTSALSWAASGAIRLRLPPPNRVEVGVLTAAICPNKIGWG